MEGKNVGNLNGQSFNGHPSASALSVVAHLHEKGFGGPVSVLTELECQQFLASLQNKPPMDWLKGQAASSRPYYEIGTHPAILSVVEEALGPNVMLWGATVITVKDGSVHPWHSDVETSGPTGKTVTVWLGIENVTTDSGLQFISYSHAFGETIQQVRVDQGVGRCDATTENVLAWAKQKDPRAEVCKPVVSTGQALFFQGQTWHHSDNKSGKQRRALLLQYATPETPMRIPDMNYLDWPFRHKTLPKPPCVMVRGSDTVGINRIVPAPAPTWRTTMAQLNNQIYPLQVPLPPSQDLEKGFKPYTMFRGSTSDLREMEVHASTLLPGKIPHPPHQHIEEEILIMLSGEADLILPSVKGPAGDERHPIKPGEFVYYPAQFAHTLRTTGTEPANYLMFKWHAAHGKGTPLGFGKYTTSNVAQDKETAFRYKILFEGPTQCLRKFQCHLSVLDPGAGYPPHADAYDVAIILLEGEIETLGERVKPFGTIFHPAGQMHGINNPTDKPAKYLVFEFYGSQVSDGQVRNTKRHENLLQKVTDPQRWKGKAKKVIKKLLKR
jgi:quercetin dioxygenase-like cupin family protein